MLIRSYKHRMPLPDRVANAPEMPLGMDLYFTAFAELSSCRPVGMGMGAIPWTSMIDYAKAYEFDDEQREDLFFFVRALDKAFLDYHKEKQDK